MRDRVRRAATRVPGVLAGTSLAPPPRGDNFNLNKWPGGRHLCPRLVLFILDYSVRTCAAVSSAGRVRCLLSRVNVFQNPPGIYLVIPDRRAGRPADRPDPSSRSPLRLSRLAAAALRFCVDLCDHD